MKEAPPIYSIHAKKPASFDAYDFEFNTPGRVWRFLGEQITCGFDVEYPVDDSIVKSIREIEPEFFPVVIRSAYASPSGAKYVFARHAIALAPSHPEGRHIPIKALTPVYGKVPRHTLIINSILDDEKTKPVPGLAVNGYAPFDWSVYYKVKRAHWLWRNQENAKTAEQDAAAIEREQQEIDAEAARKREAEADYRFDHAGGMKAVRELPDVPLSDWREFGSKAQYVKKPYVI